MLTETDDVKPIEGCEPFYYQRVVDETGNVDWELCFDSSLHKGQQQLIDWLDNSHERKLLLMCAQQSGKTVALVYSLLHMMLSLGPDKTQGGGCGQYLIVIPDLTIFTSGIQEFFERIFRDELGILGKYNSTRRYYDVLARGNRMIAAAAGQPYNPKIRTRIYVVHLQNTTSTAAFRAKGIVADEVGYKGVPKKQLMELLDARTSTHNARVVMASYPDAREAFVEMYERADKDPDSMPEYGTLNFPRWYNPVHWKVDLNKHTPTEALKMTEERMLDEAYKRGDAQWEIDRTLKGLPTLASGAFFSSFTNRNIKEYQKDGTDELAIGIDCGAKSLGVTIGKLKRNRNDSSIRYHIIDEYRYDEKTDKRTLTIEDHVEKIKAIIRKHRVRNQSPVVYCGMGGKPSGIDSVFFTELRKAGVPCKSPPIRNPAAQGSIVNSMLQSKEMLINPELYQLHDDLTTVETLDNGNPDDSHFHVVSSLRYIACSVHKMRGTEKQVKKEHGFKGERDRKKGKWGMSHQVPKWYAKR